MQINTGNRRLLTLAAAILFALRMPLPAAAGLAVPALTGRVVDQAGFLAGGDAARVERAIRELEQATGGQMAVLTVPTLGGDALEPFSMRVAESWKIGWKGQDNGALLVLVRDSHDIRLEMGRGWEGPVNDARAGDIIRGMGPFFHAGRFGDGLVYAVQHVQTDVSGKAPQGAVQAPTSAASAQSNPGDGLIRVGKMSINPIWGFIAWIVFIVVIGMLSKSRRGRTYGSGGCGGWSGGGGFSSGGGGFSGGGGSFSGGGASGKW